MTARHPSHGAGPAAPQTGHRVGMSTRAPYGRGTTPDAWRPALRQPRPAPALGARARRTTDRASGGHEHARTLRTRYDTRRVAPGPPTPLAGALSLLRAPCPYVRRPVRTTGRDSGC